MQRLVLLSLLFSLLALPFPSHAWDPKCDVNQDNVVDGEDIFLIQQHWHSVPPTSTPVATWTPLPPTVTATATKTDTPQVVTPTASPTATETPEPPLTEVRIDLAGLPAGATPLVMVRIPAGSFIMGSSDDSTWSWCHPCEQPVHTVTIPHDFYIGKYEVTQAQWEAVMGENPAHGNGVGNDFPVYYVSWNNCQSFVDSLNALVPGGGFRLPSEAEWEYACRARTTTRYSFGDSDCEPVGCLSCELDLYARWCVYYDPVSQPVGMKLPNPWGLHDVHGNLCEWVQDNWNPDYIGAPANGDAWEDTGYVWRVNRGNFWGADSKGLRSADRRRSAPGGTYNYVGVRLARTP